MRRRQGIYGPGTDLADRWARDRRAELDAGRLRAVVAARRIHVETTPEARPCIHYVFGNRHRMRYPQFRARGPCVSSGVVEAGCKQIGDRLKRRRRRGVPQTGQRECAGLRDPLADRSPSSARDGEPGREDSFGAAFVAAFTAEADHSDSTVACACGGKARYAGRRPKTFTTLLGPLTLERAYYHCAHSGETDHPFRWQTDHLFRRKPITRSDANRSPVGAKRRGTKS